MLDDRLGAAPVGYETPTALSCEPSALEPWYGPPREFSFAAEVQPEFKAREAERRQAKTDELAPYIEAALARKQWMRPLDDGEIPVVEAAVKRAQTSGRV